MTFLESLKESHQSSAAVRKDIPSLIKMIQETTNNLIEMIKKKGNVIEMGTVEWRKMPIPDQGEAELVTERCVGSGKYFLGKAIEEEFV